MRLKNNEIASFLRAAKPPASAVLIYGPDEGLVRERGVALAKKICEDLNDAFLVTSLSDTDIKQDPAALANAVGSLSLMGGDRLIRVRPAADAITKNVEAAIAELAPVDQTDCWVIIEAGDLTPRSSLRKMFEKSKTHVALPCYADDARAVGDMIREVTSNHGLTVAPDAMGALSELLGGDRGLTRQELEKLCLYVGPDVDNGEITAAHVHDIVTGSGEAKLDALITAVATGDMRAADKEYEKAISGGMAPVGVIRMLTNQMKTLHMLAAIGGNPSEAVRALRPPVRFPRDKALIRQAGHWPRAACERALLSLEAAEAECKTTALPDEAICGRLILSLTRSAANARR